MARKRGTKQVRIDDNIYAKLNQIADAKHVSITWLINDMLRQAIIKE